MSARWQNVGRQLRTNGVALGASDLDRDDADRREAHRPAAPARLALARRDSKQK